MDSEKTDEMSDEEVVKCVRSGSTDDFGVLIERYRSKMERYARKFIADPDVIEDAVQDVFVKAYTNIQSFNTSMKFSSWLYRIAHNTYINVIRKKKYQPILFFDSDTLFAIPSSEKIDEELSSREDREELDKYLRHLDPKYREPLVLFYFEEKSYKEIANILRIPTSTVGVRIKRGRTKLKSHYE